MNGEPKTVGQAARRCLVVAVLCPSCNVESYFLSEDLERLYGHGKLIESLPFKCTKCGSNKSKTHLRLPLRSGQTGEVVRPSMAGRKVRWKPVQLKFGGDR